MAITGPLPKRSDELIRRNVPDVAVTKITAIGPVDVPDLNLGEVHPLVKDLYESMRDSGQSKYYEPTDWQYARLTLYVLNEMLLTEGIGAMKLAAVNTMLTNLLLTEGDRRRVRIEVERNQNQEQVGKVLEVADLFRQALTKQPGNQHS